MKCQLAIAGCLLLALVHPAAADIKVGDRAPSIEAGSWYNLPPGIKSLRPDDLRGQLVMVEFWATWCVPCRAGIPHLIQLQEKYKSRGVVLVALSYEKSDLVAPFVVKHKIPYIVGGDADKMQDAFCIRGYPSAVLVDPKGNVAWTGHPLDAEEAIEALLKKCPPMDGCFFQRNAATKAIDRTSVEVATMGAGEKTPAQVRREEADRVAGRWLETARLMAKNGARNDAIHYYEKIIKKYPDSSYADSARDELTKIRGG